MSINKNQSKHTKHTYAAIPMLCFLVAMMLAQGCATSGGTKNETVNVADFGMPSPGKAKVIFFRPTSNGGVDLGVHDGERLIAKLGGESYGVYECEPGQHVFSGSLGNLEILDANLSTDRIYYVKAVLEVQMWTPAFVKMTPVHPGSAAEWNQMIKVLPELEKTVVTPEQEQRDRKGIARYMERLKVYRDKPGAVFPTILSEYGQSTPAFPSR